MADVIKSKGRYIAVAGNIGAGKSSLTGLLANKFSWDPHYESVDDNPYLSDFYEDNNNLHMYNVRVRFCPINQNIKFTLTSEYICVPKENIIFCFPE